MRVTKNVLVSAVAAFVLSVGFSFSVSASDSDDGTAGVPGEVIEATDRGGIEATDRGGIEATDRGGLLGELAALFSGND